jgi:hypothetical protein
MIKWCPHLIVTIILTAYTQFVLCQTWQALNPPLNIFNGTIYATTADKSGNIYAAGDFKNSSRNNFVAAWNGTSWNELGSGSSALNANGTILTLASNGDTIYAAGAFINKLNQKYIAKWNGTSWSELDINNSLHANDFIYSVAVDKLGNVYAAGRFTNAAGKCYVAKWDGRVWTELGTGANALNANNAIFAVATDASGNVYAGGYFTNAAGKQYIAKWNGSTWIELGGTNALSATGFINCIATDSNGNVYTAGDFRNSSGEYYVAKWNGTTWAETRKGTDALHANGSIKTIGVNGKNEMYVAGYFTDPFGNYYVAKWDGQTWSQVNNSQGLLQANQSIQTITVDAVNNIYAGGKFLNKSGRSFVGKWDGTGWREMGWKGDPFYTAQPIYQIVADTVGNVYVSGYFPEDGGRNHIEHWNDGSGAWKQMRLPDNSGLYFHLMNDQQMAVDSKGNLYVTGRYQTTDSNGYDCILKWNGLEWSILENFRNELGTHNTNSVYGISEIEMDPQGNIYVAGYFIDSASNWYSLAKWDGKTWTRLTGSAADYIQNFCVAGDGNIYAYGNLTGEPSLGGIIANYNPATHVNWKEVKNGNSRLTVGGYNILKDIKTDSKNNLYLNGDLTNSSGQRYIAKWNGTSWSEFGVTDELGYTIAIDREDNIYANNYTNSSVHTILKRWNGTSWINISMLPGSDSIYAYGDVFATDAAGTVYANRHYSEISNGTQIARYRVKSIIPPKLSAFAPTSGSVGTTITIKGKNLTGTAWVGFGGTKASSFSIKNDSTITAVVGNGSTGSVVVITIEGTDSLKTFTYTCDSVKGPVPYISSARDSILTSSYANNYQWFYNNQKLNNETSSSLRVKDAGFYHVETSADKVCWVQSLDYPVLISPSPLSDSLKLNIYPNPSTGSFTAYLKLPRTTTVKTYVQVFDATGLQILQTSKLIFYGNEIRIPITINNKGTFVVKIFVNDVAVQQSVIII